MAMLKSCRSRIGDVYRVVRRIIGSALTFILTRTLFKSENAKLLIGLDTSKISDGSGAQVQRILATRLISHIFKVGYIHNRIQTVQIHPLDPFQDEKSYSGYLEKLNLSLDMSSTNIHGLQNDEIRVSSISFWTLIKYQVLTKYSSRTVKLSITDPYPVSELLVNHFPVVREYLLSSLWSDNRYVSKDKKKIVVHHRQGAGGQSIYPGQKISRELDVSYFLSILELISTRFEKSPKDEMEICVLTDAPQSEITFTPPENQIALWVGTPGFLEGKVIITGASLEDIFLKSGFIVTVKSGGDPLEAILEMTQSDYLITARSSLSYVAGILNEGGVIFSAPGFWHKPLPSWLNGGDLVQL